MESWRVLARPIFAVFRALLLRDYYGWAGSPKTKPPLAEINAMRCEMACAATSMSYLPAHPLDAPAAARARAPPYVPPATCAADAVTNATGLAASLIELLDRRKRVPEGSASPRCRCHAKPRHWHSTYSHSSA